MVQLLSGKQKDRRCHCEKQTGADHRLQRRTGQHIKQNAIIQAAKMGIAIEGATLYCTHQPCVICSKMIVNAGIARVVYEYPYPDEFAREILSIGGVVAEHYPVED